MCVVEIESINYEKMKAICSIVPSVYRLLVDGFKNGKARTLCHNVIRFIFQVDSNTELGLLVALVFAAFSGWDWGGPSIPP